MVSLEVKPRPWPLLPALPMSRVPTAMSQSCAPPRTNVRDMEHRDADTDTLMRPSGGLALRARHPGSARQLRCVSDYSRRAASGERSAASRDRPARSETRQSGGQVQIWVDLAPIHASEETTFDNKVKGGVTIVESRTHVTFGARLAGCAAHHAHAHVHRRRRRRVGCRLQTPLGDGAEALGGSADHVASRLIGLI